MGSENIQHNNGAHAEKRIPWWREAITPLNFFTLLLVIVAALQACILRNTDITLSDTLQTNRASQRAFVYPVLLQTYISPDPINAPNFGNFIYSFANSGNTATKDFHFKLACVPSVQQYSEPWFLLAQQKIDNTASAVIAPHSGQTAGCTFATDQIKEMSSNKLFGYILIESTYEDRLSPGKMRLSQYAVQLTQITYKPAITEGANKAPAQLFMALTNIGSHNCADNECPTAN